MRATRPWFPPSFVPPTTYHRVRMWEYILISLSHTHSSTDQTRDRRIAGSGHQCISMGPALAIHFSPGSAISLFGSWSPAILAFTNTRALAPPQTQTLGQLGNWALGTDTDTNTHGNRREDSLAKANRWQLIWVTAWWSRRVVGAAAPRCSMSRPTDEYVPVPVAVGFETTGGKLRTTKGYSQAPSTLRHLEKLQTNKWLFHCQKEGELLAAAQ